MREIIMAIRATILLLTIAVAASSATPSHCTPTEQVVFNCQIQGLKKLLSLCASGDFGKTSGYLQYRFGQPEKVELEFPQERTRTQDQFPYEHDYRFQVDRTEISFSNHGHEYTIYSYYEGDGPGEPLQSEGIVVGDVDLPCTGRAQADFSLLNHAMD